MPATFDLVMAALIGIAYPIVDYFWSWPRMRRHVLAGDRDARVPVYAEIMATLWGATLVVATARTVRRLPWPDVGIAIPGGWRLALALALVAALAMLMRAQRRAIVGLSDEARRRVQARMGDLDLIVPHTPRERAWFVGVSLTAGVCEEFLYRGFLVWALSPWLGLWGASAASLASFVSAHAYQGRSKLPNVALVGALFALLAIVMHSVLPGMLLHAMVDVMGGETAYAIGRPVQGRAGA